MGLNVVIGMAGLLDLGYAAFFAIGAYAMGLLNSPVVGSPLYGHGWSFWICIWIAAAVSALLGTAIGAPTLRVRGDYLAVLMAEEVAHRAQTRIQRCVRRAHLPFLKTIDEYDFTFQSAVRLSLLGSALVGARRCGGCACGVR